MDKTLNEILSETPLVWADHIVAAYVLGLKDMLAVQTETHRNIQFDVFKGMAESCAKGRRYEFKDGVDF